MRISDWSSDVCSSDLLASLVLSSLVSFAAHAQVDGTGDYLSRMDSDGDGRISLVEYQDWMSYAFDGMDRNRDGRLNPDEPPGGKRSEERRVGKEFVCTC